MSLFTFKGGVHLYDGKELTKDIPVKRVLPKGEIVLPVSQHIGAFAKPIVVPGERVLKGQLIAKADGLVSANIHSSVSGNVKKIEPRLVVSGEKQLSVVIENDELYEEVVRTPEDEPWTKEYIRETMKDCGIVGLGGACFPTHVKVTPKNDRMIDYVIVNAAECEPYITVDHRRLTEQPQEVIEGLKILLQLFENAKGVIAVENNKPEIIQHLKLLTKEEPRVEVAALKTKYPQGSERHMISAITGRKINSKRLPADAGCIVDNVDTVYHIYQALRFHKPLTERIVTVSGDGIVKPGNFLVPLGMSYRQLVAYAGGMNENTEKMISGGPMMGQAMFTLDVPVTKGSSAFLAFLYDDIAYANQTNCLNCGKCVAVCPEGLLCAKLAQAADADDQALFLKLYGMECIECGTCNYICPANLNITQSVRAMKRKVQDTLKKGVG